MVISASLSRAESPAEEPGGQPDIRQLSESAILLNATSHPDLCTQRRIWQLVQILHSEGYTNHLTEMVPGMGNLLLLVEPGNFAAQERLMADLPRLWESSSGIDLQGRRVHIPVVYGGDAGPDLPHVAAHTGMSVSEVIRRHSEVEYPVFCLGFQPGFAYLGGLDPALHTPRRTRPRPSVATGSVGIGGSQTGIYPAPSPGGWQIIGRTDEKLFNLAEVPPCLLQPGDTVCFIATSG